MRLSILLIAACAVSFACGDSITGARDRLQLSVIIDRSIITTAESTTASITVRNNSPAVVTVSTGGCVVLPSIALQTTGELVYPRGHGVCPAVLHSLRFPPGTTTLGQLVIYGADLERPGRPTLARGEYVISAMLQSSEPTLRAAPASITVQ